MTGTLGLTGSNPILSFSITSLHIDNLTKVSVQYETEQLRNLGIDEISKATANTSKRVYSIDKVNGKYGWTYDEHKRDFFTSEEISDYAFNWIVNELTSVRTA